MVAQCDDPVEDLRTPRSKYTDDHSTRKLLVIIQYIFQFKFNLYFKLIHAVFIKLKIFISAPDNGNAAKIDEILNSLGELQKSGDKQSSD